MSVTDFRWQGACRDEDPELFFPVGETAAFAAQIAEAKAVCASCPVLAKCRPHAIDNEPYGIWGGLTESERAAIRRNEANRRRAAAAAPRTDRVREREAAWTQLYRARKRLEVVRRAGDEAAIREVEARVAAAEQRLEAAKVGQSRPVDEQAQQCAAGAVA